MKVHILYPFVNGPWGGANQFLKALRESFIRQGVYEEDAYCADLLLFNSSPLALYDLLQKIYKIKKKYPNMVIVSRMDGPVFLIRGNDLAVDKALYHFSNAATDGTIFQSQWSKEKNYLQGMCKKPFESVIINAPNASVFNQNNKKPFHCNQKIRLIATSWSSNYKKGFTTYEWLDKNLNFSRYEMIFIGNSPIKFKNIRHIHPLDTDKLAIELKKSDIFITASQKDPCSNSLIEALHCGLPAIVLNDGGHPELLGKGGEAFTHVEEVPILLDKVVDSYLDYQGNIQVPSMEKIGEVYYRFLEGVFLKSRKSNCIPKKFNWFSYLKIKKMLVWWRGSQYLIKLKKRIWLF